jgi:oligosaccharide repeat unit polymerase
LLERLRLPWRSLRATFYISFVVILVAYAIWLLILMKHGVSLNILASGLEGDAGAGDQIKNPDETIPGVTTLTQMAAGFVLLGLILINKFGWKNSLYTVITPMVVLLGITWIRSKLWSERLAVLELLIPFVVLGARIGGFEKWKPWKRKFIAATPFIAPLFLFIFFSIAEYSRSWLGYYSGRQDSFILFSFLRLTGYYVTALNNGALLVQTIHHYDVPFQTLQWFWKFPFINTLLPYERFGHLDPQSDYDEMLKNLANPELNNPSGIFVVRADYGYYGGICAWFAAGVVAMLLYRSFVKGNLAGLLLYPFFYIGMLDAPRVIYWGLGRGIPTWGLLFFILLLSLVASETLRPTRKIREGIVRLNPGGQAHPASSCLKHVPSSK